jgi:DNA modification methylase
MALKLNRKPIGIEINPEYIEIAKERITPYLQQVKLTSLLRKHDN